MLPHAVTVNEYYRKSKKHKKHILKELNFLSCKLDINVRKIISKIYYLNKTYKVKIETHPNWFNRANIHFGMIYEESISNTEETSFLNNEMNIEWPVVEKKGKQLKRILFNRIHPHRRFLSISL